MSDNTEWYPLPAEKPAEKPDLERLQQQRMESIYKTGTPRERLESILDDAIKRATLETELTPYTVDEGITNYEIAQRDIDAMLKEAHADMIKEITRNYPKKPPTDEEEWVQTGVDELNCTQKLPVIKSAASGIDAKEPLPDEWLRTLLELKGEIQAGERRMANLSERVENNLIDKVGYRKLCEDFTVMNAAMAKRMSAAEAGLAGITKRLDTICKHQDKLADTVDAHYIKATDYAEFCRLRDRVRSLEVWANRSPGGEK